MTTSTRTSIGGDGRRYEGAVESGAGEGAAFVSLDGYRTRFRRRLGYEPFPGTLNVALGERPALGDPIEIEAWSDGDREFGAVDCYPITVGGVDGHVVVPHRTHHPEELVEIIAPVELRAALDLSDGDTVVVAPRE